MNLIILNIQEKNEDGKHAYYNETVPCVLPQLDQIKSVSFIGYFNDYWISLILVK